MANLADIISSKNENDVSWKEARQAERDNAVSMRDSGINAVTSDPELYRSYLKLQGDNPTYSAGNIVLCLFQLKDPTMIGTKEKWRSMGRYVLDKEQNKGAKIFVRPSSPNARGYNIGDAYDISQTQGKEITAIRLENNSPAMEKALASLLNYSPVEIATDPELESPALYDEYNMTLLVNPDLEDNRAFAGIATEIALARLHNKGRNEYYNREESFLDADSISYLICRRFGIERELPDASNIAAINDGFTVESRADALNHIQDMAKQIGGTIERQIAPLQRTQARPARTAR